MPITSISINNFKSIQKAENIPLHSLNILIGANGSGKSNFIGFMKFLNKLCGKQLQLFTGQNGRAENILYFGLKKSDSLSGKICFGNDWKNEYEFTLIPNTEGSFVFSSEICSSTDPETFQRSPVALDSAGRSESRLQDNTSFKNGYLKNFFDGVRIFHFHDTGFSSKMKQPSTIQESAYLYEDGGNIAAYLYKLKNNNLQHFSMIEKVVQSAAPFFDRFFLEPDELNPEQIFLRWLEIGSDKIFSVHNLSDGTLRFICLTALLLQPEVPQTIIIDEPELGLHPFAVSKLADMLKIAAENNSQIIVSTQSVSLVNLFSADDIIVVERENNQSAFKRLSSEILSEWLDEYSIGELWEKNVLGGRP